MASIESCILCLEYSSSSSTQVAFETHRPVSSGTWRNSKIHSFPAQQLHIWNIGLRAEVTVPHLCSFHRASLNSNFPNFSLFRIYAVSNPDHKRPLFPILRNATPRSVGPRGDIPLEEFAKKNKYKNSISRCLPWLVAIFFSCALSCPFASRAARPETLPPPAPGGKGNGSGHGLGPSSPPGFLLQPPPPPPPPAPTFASSLAAARATSWL